MSETDVDRLVAYGEFLRLYIVDLENAIDDAISVLYAGDVGCRNKAISILERAIESKEDKSE